MTAMKHTRETWAKHPGRNPAHRFGEGRPRWERRIADPRTGATHTFTVLGPPIVNRWLPHQGKRETARRRQPQS